MQIGYGCSQGYTAALLGLLLLPGFAALLLSTIKRQYYSPMSYTSCSIQNLSKTIGLFVKNETTLQSKRYIYDIFNFISNRNTFF